MVDADSRYLYYTTDRIKTATLIGRLRRLDMPVQEVGLFLSGETQAREQTLTAHRSRLLERVQSAGEPRELMTNPAWDPNPDHAWVQLIWSRLDMSETGVERTRQSG